MLNNWSSLSIIINLIFHSWWFEFILYKLHFILSSITIQNNKSNPFVLIKISNSLLLTSLHCFGGWLFIVYFSLRWIIFSCFFTYIFWLNRSLYFISEEAEADLFLQYPLQIIIALNGLSSKESVFNKGNYRN